MFGNKNIINTEDDDGDVVVSKVDPEAVDNLLAKELKEMSFQTRTEIYEEIHGVRTFAVDETPQLLQESLRQLKFQIGKIPFEEKRAYQTAPIHSYVHGDDFQLRFLRADLMDPTKAAIRMVNFLDLLVEYYGPIALQRPIQLSDLGKESMDILKAGQTLQMLPFRDRSGRRILTCVTDFGLQYNYDDRVRVQFLAGTNEQQTLF
jgi:hypothetical protein